ncbi:putative choline transporter, neither null mutation nor overexpression affects choline transport [Phlyctochytrium bullatum]|nr:putative choline transporter, neither null mutation nor overexpression affects choline transport [Phlyctochytrium bullatum]
MDSQYLAVNPYEAPPRRSSYSAKLSAEPPLSFQPISPGYQPVSPEHPSVSPSPLIGQAQMHTLSSSPSHGAYNDQPNPETNGSYQYGGYHMKSEPYVSYQREGGPKPDAQTSYQMGGTFVVEGLESNNPYGLPAAKPPRIVERPRCRDLWAVILFLAANTGFIVVIVLGLPESVKKLNEEKRPLFNDTLDLTTSWDYTLTSKDLGNAIGVGVGTGLGWSLIYFVLMMFLAGPLIHFTYFVACGLMAGLVAYYAIAKAWVQVAITALLALLFIINYFLVFTRIPFATVMLKATTRVITRFSGTIVVGILGIAVSCAYTVLWVTSSIGLAQNLKDKGMNTGAIVGIFVALVLLLFWTCEVVRNTIHVTVSGTFATVYFEGVTDPETNKLEVPSKHTVTLRSAGRAVTTSFGPICFGSLVVAIISTLKSITMTLERMARKQGNCLLCLVACCLSCCLSCLKGLMEYLNKYAYTQVAIYGKNYCEAAKATWELLSTRGLDAVVNDSLIGNVLFVGSLIGAVGCGSVGYAYVRFSATISPTITNYIVVCSICAVIGFWLFLVLSEVIQSGVSTTFVCLAEDPASLAKQQPELFRKFHEVWPDVKWGMQSTA